MSARTTPEVGKFYAVRYRAQSGNGRWSMKSMTGRYLGTSGPGHSLSMQFDLRPLAGTATIHTNNIMQILGPLPSTTRPRTPHSTRS